MTKILLVEDDLSIANVYSIKLGFAKYEFRHAVNGLRALKILNDFRPDLVLLDLRMPVMDGETFLEKFRKFEEYRETPVIVLTNINRSEAPNTIWHLGISAYVVKAHTTPGELIKLIEETLNRH